MSTNRKSKTRLAQLESISSNRENEPSKMEVETSPVSGKGAMHQSQTRDMHSMHDNFQKETNDDGLSKERNMSVMDKTPVGDCETVPKSNM